MSRFRFLAILLLVFSLGAARESRAQAPGYTVAFSATQYTVPESQYYHVATLNIAGHLPDNVFITLQITEYPGGKTTQYGYGAYGSPAAIGVSIYNFTDDNLYNPGHSFVLTIGSDW